MYGYSFGERLTPEFMEKFAFYSALSSDYTVATLHLIPYLSLREGDFVANILNAIVKTAETLEGVQNNIIDIGGFCFCFEPSNLPLHAFQTMLPFGTCSADNCSWRPTSTRPASCLSFTSPSALASSFRRCPSRAFGH